MKAAIDESMPVLPGGVAYVVAAAVVIADDAAVDAADSEVLASSGRTRPFHWHVEGTRIREAMTAALIELGAVVDPCVHHPTGRRKLEAAREKCLQVIVPRLIEDGVSELAIEKRSREEDVRDRRTFIRIVQNLADPVPFVYDWHHKGDPWIALADGVCGAIHDFLVGGDSTHYDRLTESRVIPELIYLNERWGPGNA